MAVERAIGRTKGKLSELASKRLTRENSRRFSSLKILALGTALSRFFGGGGFLASLSGSSGVFENQGAAVVELDFLGFPCGTLVESVGIGI